MLRRIRCRGRVVELVFESEDEARLFLGLLGLNPGSSLDDGLRVRVEWDRGMREKYVLFLRRKRPPVRDPETIGKYVRCVERFLSRTNGVIDVDGLLRYVRTKHDNRAVRNLLHFLYYYRYIDKYVYQELLSRVPRPGDGGNGLAEDYVPLSIVLRSLAKAEEFREPLRSFYYALYYTGGQRMEQLMEALKEPQVVELHDKDYVRIRVHGTSTKTAAWAWIPQSLLGKLASKPLPYTPGGLRARLRKAGVVTPTYVRSFCWQVAKQLLGHDLALLLQGRIGELKRYTTALSYDDLVYQLDEKYWLWREFINVLVENSNNNVENSLEAARRIRNKYNLVVPI